MSSTYTPHLERWLEAERRASAAAVVFMRKFKAYMCSGGPPPSKEEQAEVRRLRDESVRLYQLAIEEMKEVSHQIVARRSMPGTLT